MYVRATAVFRRFNEGSAWNPVARRIFVPRKWTSPQTSWLPWNACRIHRGLKGSIVCVPGLLDSSERHS